ncbi:MAG: apolipoprotein N-acyltransferase [Omnitrophica WOR_2 bacterium RIFCSPLOWO2_12_FULL_50_9]|nr:MAG: apolipoprotein N-acyltransferase [Omnitrophica WOR_2 bacterium RIFCSPHIGHO2_02_FULL_50_17]OGX40639.1 MAG: apolipoprotein N-acyltransferase [Omnitrophica WOR_2 bacterium RIFCSPLOWO2_12_FULL_50_9]
MRGLFMKCRLKDFCLCVFSSVLLVLAFPKTEISALAWVGLVPLMTALDGKDNGRAFFLSYLCGVFFFGGVLYWFVHVTALGAVLLVLYLALYFALFGVGYSFFSPLKTIQRLFLLPSLWTVLEFIRAHFLTGFGWAALGHSQYRDLALIQIADVTGVFGVSFLVVMVNVFFKEIVPMLFHKGGAYRKGMFYSTLMACVLLSVLGYGTFRLKSLNHLSAVFSHQAPQALIAVVQANIPQERKWHEPAWPDIMAEYMALTKEVARRGPDLIIWPETSFPGILWEEKALFEELQDFVRQMKIPLLVGAVTREGKDYYNSALLLSKEGGVIGQYRKVHLVPFGEYIPMRSLFPFLSQIVPIADFTAGKEYTIFPLSVRGEGRGRPASISRQRGRQGAFSVLICFEDTVARLSRRLAQRGAQLLVNITNDAWFEDTKAPFLHLQSAVFRTVENRRGLVRSANTGVSCFIDAFGRIVQAVQNDRHKTTYVRGYAVAEVRFSREETFYTKFGDVFTFGCLGCILAMIVRKKYI